MPKVLIADDNTDLRRILAEFLEACGYEVYEAVDGIDAWEILQIHQADVILSDIDMPRLDGVGLSSQLLCTPLTANIPIILVSGKPPPAKPTHVFELLCKPVHMDVLLSTLDRALASSDYK